MKISREAATTARRAFRMCLEGDRLDDDKLRKAFGIITRSKPRNYQAILHALLRLVRLEVSKREVRVESAVPLHESEQNRLRSSLTSQYGPDLNFEFADPDPTLLGGVRVRVGNDVFDGTVKNRLERLERSF